MPTLTPIVLLTGYLGAGKTSLMNHILASGLGGRVAVIVNDIGEVNIDAELIARSGGTVDDGLVALQNGCICCSLKDDLVQQLLDLIATRRFERILIEASGICEPMPIAQAICGGDPALAAECRLDAVVTVVDARRMVDEFLGGRALIQQSAGGAGDTGGAGYGEDADVEALLVQQIEFCSAVIINKVSDITPEQLDELRAIIRRIQPEARIIETDFCRLDAGDVEDVFAPRGFDFARVGRSAGWIREMQRYDALQVLPMADANHDLDGHDHSDCDHEHGICHCGHGHGPGHSHGEEYGISSFVYVRRPGFDPDKFAAFMENEWPRSIIRCKGIAWFTAATDECT